MSVCKRWMNHQVEYRVARRGNARSGKGGYRVRARMWSGNGSRWKIVGYFRMQADGSHDPRERRATTASYSSFKPRIFDRGNVKYERSAIHIVWILAACFIGKIGIRNKSNLPWNDSCGYKRSILSLYCLSFFFISCTSRLIINFKTFINITQR